MRGTENDLEFELAEMCFERPMQRYEILKRYGAVAHDAVVWALNRLIDTGTIEDDGVFLRTVR